MKRKYNPGRSQTRYQYDNKGKAYVSGGQNKSYNSRGKWVGYKRDDFY